MIDIIFSVLTVISVVLLTRDDYKVLVNAIKAKMKGSYKKFLFYTLSYVVILTEVFLHITRYFQLR